MIERPKWWPKDAREQDFADCCKECLWPELCHGDQFCWLAHKEDRIPKEEQE